MYRRRNPAKLSELDTQLAKFSGLEVELYEYICKQYGEASVFAFLAEE